MSTLTPIQSFTLASSATSIILSNLPQTYTDLIVQCTFGVSTGSDIAFRFNNDDASLYSTQRLAANSTNVAASRVSSSTRIDPRTPANQTTTITTPWSINIMNYSSSSTNKTTTQRYGHSDAFTEVSTGLYRSLDAVKSITLFTIGGPTFQSGTTVNIYGIEAGTPKAQGGDIVTTDGTYWYHQFLASGTLTTYSAITADYLVVAGGGGAGLTTSFYSGGGGAGGLRCTVGATGGGGSLESALSLSASKTYTITVGAGGSGGESGAITSAFSASNGSNSSIAGTGITTITSTGGGASTHSTSGGSTGGSGGGGTGGGNGGAGTTNQGFAGGNSTSTPSSGSGGGGGGAGGAGTAGTTVGGAGGAGVTTSISGTSTSYAGGGGGASASASGTATAGGGAGKTTGAPNNGTANRGGGGGATNVYNGGNGGSGIVIIRYAV